MKMYTVKTLRLLAWTAVASLGLLAGLIGPARAEGIKMPGTIKIKYIQNQYRPVVFDHAMHVSIAEGCGTCHHQHNDKMKSTCSECHSLNAAQFKASAKQGFAACSGCHTDNSPGAPEMPGLKVALHKKCFQCHVGIGDLGFSPAACVKTCHARK